MRRSGTIYRLSALLLLIGLAGVLVCSGMTTLTVASAAPAGCPLHSQHGSQVPACCSANQRTDALTEAELQIPDLAMQGIQPIAVLGFAEMIPDTSTPVDGLSPQPPSLLP